ncbi:19444_t:CDS:2, partial [Racocetra persica]
MHDSDSNYNILDDYNELALERAKLLASEKENNYDEDIEWENLDYKSFETVLVATGLTE